MNRPSTLTISKENSFEVIISNGPLTVKELYKELIVDWFILMKFFVRFIFVFILVSM